MKSAEATAAKVVELRPRFRGRNELEFLPAALEIVETPPSPLGRAVAASLTAFLVIAIAWAYLGRIDVIATAQGKVVPTGRVKQVQPLEAGMVSAINVKDGDRVKQGDILVTVDQTSAKADRDRILPELQHARLDVARLSALTAGLSGDLRPVGFAPPGDIPFQEVARARANMVAQAEQQIAKINGLNEQIAQRRAEVDGISATIEKIEAELPLLIETADIREKAMKIQYGNRIAHLEAQMRLTEQRHELVVQQRHGVEAGAAERSLVAQLDQARADYARGLSSDLADAEQKVAQLSEDLVKAERRLHDQILRAPIDGTVQQLAIHTVGGVVTPAQTLMVIVPAESKLEIEAMVANKDIGFVREGNEAAIKVDTFNFTKYGLLHGRVTSVSRDAVARERPVQQGMGAQKPSDLATTSEPAGQELLYVAHTALDQTQMLVDDRMVDVEPGMAVTVEIKTGRRRIIEYLLSPLMRYKHESLRER
ncbi:HlyD family type I secretion periplasmic adaptor subunit [Bradyrhizobium sp. LMG 9283]|uniref:HlyD family type I secretion periplasmic adaptor subunit n=1 Tax=Bradyrhizobium sp. LMG 9283 TaxID=592064 RepID=UPI00388EB9C7